jgi:threonine aldolase
MLDPAKTKLQEWSFFWDWDIDRHQVRWMTSWDTSPADIDAFIAGVGQVLGG